MGVITHRPWPEEMLQVRRERLLKASLDALGLPAPAGACDPHICPSSTGGIINRLQQNFNGKLT